MFLSVNNPVLDFKSPVDKGTRPIIGSSLYHLNRLFNRISLRNHMIDYSFTAKAVDVKMKKDSPFNRARVVVALFSVAATVGLGLLTPGPNPSAASNAIIGGFTVALMMAMATVFAMIPAPPDPRRLLLARVFRRDRHTENEEDRDKGGSAVRYTGFGHPIFTRPLPVPDDRAREG